MRFPNLIKEEIIQIADLTRFDMSKTFVTPDEVLEKVEISFDQVNYFDVYVEDYPEKWVFDYAFDTAATQPVYVKVTTDLGSTEKEFSIEVISEEDDNLFSTDANLFAEETELKRYIPKGKSSFKYAHRLAQRNILRFLDGAGLRNVYGVPFTAAQLKDNTYIREFSIYETLMLIFEDQRVKGNDSFLEKKKAYHDRYVEAKRTAAIRLDFDEDGEVDEREELVNLQNKFFTR